MNRDLGNIVVDMILFCPKCGAQHIDLPEFVNDLPTDPVRDVWTNPPYRSHLCHSCNHIWRPSDVHTNGVAEIRSKGVNDSTPPIRGKP